MPKQTSKNNGPQIHCAFDEEKQVVELVPHPRNPNHHSESQIKLLAKIIDSQGWRAPIVISERSGFIVAGHARLSAAQRLDLDSAPVNVQPFESEAQEYAHLVADNRIAELADMDNDALKDLLLEIDTGELDMDLTGYDHDALEQLMTQFHEDDEPEIPSEPLNESWRQWAGEVAGQFDILSGGACAEASTSPFSGVTRGAAKIYFLKSKHQGKAYPRFCSTAFHPQQFRTNGDSCSVFEGLGRVSEGDIQAERLRFFCGEVPSSSHLYGGSLPFAGSRMPLDFPAMFAKELFNEFASEGKVLDPCCGWGGRLVGFLLSDATTYQGVDVSPLQIAGVESINETLAPLADGKRTVKLLCSKYEDTKFKAGTFDFALTSPPYFDVEQYEGGEQSHQLDDYTTWRDVFYTTLIEKTFAALKPGGVFALQVGSQRYPLLEDGKRIADVTGFEVYETRQTNITNHFKDTPEETAEVILILKKHD